MNKVIVIILCLILVACKSVKKTKVLLNEAIHFTVKIDISSDSTEENFDDQVVLKLPESYSESGKPTRLVYLAHGAGGGVTDSTWSFEKYSIVDSLLTNGYAVLDVNGGPNFENMGGMNVVKSAFKSYNYIKENYNVYDEIFVIGGSMGGLSSTNFVYEHHDIVLAHGMFSPVLDLYSQAWNNPWYPSTRMSIASEHNFINKSGDTWEPISVKHSNPLIRNISVKDNDTLKLYPVPVKIWHGSRDAVVKVESSRSFIKYIENSGGICELTEIDSDDHGLSCGSPEMNHEMLKFLKRNEN